MNRVWRYAVLVLGTLAYTCLTFVWFSLAAYLSAVTADLSLTPTQAGLLTGAIPLTYIPLSLVSGSVVDRVGPYRAIGAGLAVFGLAQLGRAAAGSFPAMLGLTVVVGAGATAITFGLPKLVSELFPADASGAPSSVYVLGASAGTAAAFSLGRGLLGPAAGGWRPLFRLTGLAVLGYAVCWLVAVRLAPLAAMRSADAQAADADDEVSLATLRSDVARVFASGPMRLLVVAGVVYLLVVHGFQNWLATVLEARGVQASLAATATSGFVVAAAAGTLTLPALSDRLDDRGTVIAACGAVCTLGTAALLVPGVPAVVGVAGALAAGVGAGGISPLVRVVPAELEDVGPALTGTAVGLVFAVGEAGGFLGPFLIGWLYDLSGSYAPGLAVICVCSLGAVVAGRRLPV
ncbi:MFS transporter [Salinirussus salinus]|uniref:MFS transporter n=1 Tax=Salinirussus salinus TaxID=1198300 RepID=UPI001F358D5E|nr:MFS transporter [Salinirussus salinus]